MNALCTVCKKPIDIVKEGKQLKTTAEGAECRLVKYKSKKPMARVLLCSTACASSYDALTPEAATLLLEGKMVKGAVHESQSTGAPVEEAPEVDTEPSVA